MPDGRSVLFSANRNPDWEYERRESDVYSVPVEGGNVRRLTDRRGPDSSPAVAPNGSLIAYVGFDDRIQTYQTTGLYLMLPDGSQSRGVLEQLDRSVGNPIWAADGSGGTCQQK